MESKFYLACLLLVGAAGAMGQVEQLAAHLEQLADVRSGLSEDPEPRMAARRYIKTKFREFGLEVTEQTFVTSLNTVQGNRQGEGANVVGVVIGSEGGGVVVVGADYDTGKNRAPLEDNGVGVGVMLEAARLLTQQTSGDLFELKRTVVFVAFDLNTLEYGQGQSGQPGSYYFLHQWLWPFLNQTSEGLSGAFVLDSIGKFNTDNNTQSLLPNFHDAFPQASDRISLGGNKGDFLAMFTRPDPRTARLVEAFSTNFHKDRRGSKLGLEELPVVSGVAGVIQMFNHQAHFPFWSFRPSEPLEPLPAVLLTDTDVYRLDGEMCPASCTPSVYLTPTRLHVLGKITNALTHTLLQLQAERPGSVTEPSSGGQTTHSTHAILVLSIVLALFTRL